jgi:anti-sigma regulatory factor (Ser/Thr protein kinase)
MKRDLAELKIPASSAFIPVAKRVAATLGGQLGLSLVDLDELSIALTQACDSAIAAAANLDAPADLKLSYFATNAPWSWTSISSPMRVTSRPP